MGVVLLLSIIILLEYYTYTGLSSLTSSSIFEKWVTVFYIAQCFFLLYAFYQIVSVSRVQILRSNQYNIWLGVLMISLVTKIVFCLLLLLQ
ncbi:MAG: hypothetical protein RLZZ546_2828, partial [Bacteroidota bacterium]